MSHVRGKLTLQPEVLQWARERAGFAPGQLAKKIGVKPQRVFEWEDSGSISVAQADKLAHCTHTPVGFLYLKEPPEDRLPIPDFRTRSNGAPRRPSPDLLETVQIMQRRQAWMREELIEDGAEPLAFIGSSKRYNHEEVADAMRQALGLESNWAAQESSWTTALRSLHNRIENVGVLVVCSGGVGNNTRRRLDPHEFQGFALLDEYAPLIFVNAADFKAAQMFTVVHEVAHLFIGQAGVSHFEALQSTNHNTEQFCNRAAAEFLVPTDELREFRVEMDKGEQPYQALAQQFKVSE